MTNFNIAQYFAKYARKLFLLKVKISLLYYLKQKCTLKWNLYEGRSLSFIDEVKLSQIDTASLQIKKQKRGYPGQRTAITTFFLPLGITNEYFSNFHAIL